MLVGTQRWWDEIEPRCSPRVTTAEPRQRHPPSGPQAEAADCLVGVGGAGRQVAAMEPDQRRERVTVNRDQPARGETREAADVTRDDVQTPHRAWFHRGQGTPAIPSARP